MKKWEIKSPSGSLTTVNHNLSLVGMPERFGFNGDTATLPGEMNATTPPGSGVVGVGRSCADRPEAPRLLIAAYWAWLIGALAVLGVLGLGVWLIREQRWRGPL